MDRRASRTGSMGLAHTNERSNESFTLLQTYKYSNKCSFLLGLPANISCQTLDIYN
ncbi:hypothetical protein AGR7C_pTi0211 [Agrobacterium deltaense Zutra 3/1]|uniref:Uncharacterized protein n=1 Tax=Agrobacterium deltaense Zutra 3/1 TaxID=1183427 RepID=A0A1S7S7F5_9HYPH|nr:hypothetical protein AGR7C_pTi0211 [Agrobacterium deltaense Zutra 3/1]